MKILVEGWINIPHSYAIVNVFQLFYIHKYFPEIVIYFKSVEMPTPAWVSLCDKFAIYPKNIQDFLKTIKIWKNESVDIIYRIAFPYNLTRPTSLGGMREDTKTPIVIFYTCELYKMHMEMFSPRMSEETFTTMIKLYKNLHFITPSTWSSNGMMPYTKQNTVIPHGVDLDVFKKLPTDFRQKYNIPLNKKIFLHAGAMTRSKGTYEVLFLFYQLVFIYRRPYHLVLKCSSDLYNSETILHDHLRNLSNEVLAFALDRMISCYITIIPHTVSFEKMNEIYNCADVYISPYSGEGFNIPPLEALGTGCKLIITDCGGSNEYIKELIPSKSILLLPSKLVTHGDGTRRNKVDLAKSVELILHNHEFLEETDEEEYLRIRGILEDKFSWKRVVERYVEYFEGIIH